jgi:hypothetical protein
MQRFKNLASTHSLGLLGFTFKGRTSQGGVTSPTLPQMRTAPVPTRCTNVSVMKSEKFTHDGWFLNALQGGEEESYLEPLNP